MSAISFKLVVDNVSPALMKLADPALISRATLAAGTVVGSLAQRAFDEPGLRAPRTEPVRYCSARGDGLNRRTRRWTG